MNDNLAIYVFADRYIKLYPTENVYKLVLLDDFKTDCTLDKIVCDRQKDDIFKMQHAYSEGAGIHYIWKNIELPDYIGTNHYRRYFDFWDKGIPDMKSIFEKHGAIIPSCNFGDLTTTIKDHYTLSHNIKDLDLAIDIIKNKFPKYYDISLKQYNSILFYPCNIFIVEKNTFIEWCEFVFGVLDEYNNIMNFKTDLDVYHYVKDNSDLYIKKYVPGNRIKYQTRIHAFLMEQLSTFFFCYKFESGELKPPFIEDFFLTEIQYNWELIHPNNITNRKI